MAKSKATFQPTVRPDWAGAMDYISETEQVKIFQAILMFPSVDVPESAFWTKTIKPDLEQQYKTFIESCQKKAIGIRKRWDKSIDNYTNVIDNYTDVIDKDSFLKNKSNIKEQDNNSRNNNNNLSTTRVNPTLDEILDYARQQNDLAGMGGFKCSSDTAHDFYDYYSGIGWCLPNDAKTPILDWKPFLRKWSRKPQFKTYESETVNIDDPEHFVI